jgi:Transport protein particle (TRAPP) component
MDEPLVKMRFICKQFWTALFGRQVGGLKTNHKVQSHQRIAYTNADSLLQFAGLAIATNDKLCTRTCACVARQGCSSLA